MGLSQDLKEFSAGFSSGFQLTSNLKEKRADREEKRLDRAERARIADQSNATQREVYHVPDQATIDAAPPTPATSTSTVKGAQPGEDTLSGSGGEDTIGGGAGSDKLRGSINARAQERLDFLVNELGYTREGAAGVIGNAKQESSLNHNTRPGDKGSAFGEFQWRGGRWQNFQRYAAQNKLDPKDWRTAYRFMDYEMGTTDGGRIRDKIRTAKDANAATDLFALKFERPQGSQTGNANNIHGIGNRRGFASAVIGLKPGTMTASTGAIPTRGGFKPVDYSRDTLQDDTAQQAPAVQEAGGGGGGGEEATGEEPTTVAQVDTSTGGFAPDFVTGDPYEEQPVMWSARGGAIPTRRFADAGAVDKYNPSRSYTQPLPQSDAAATPAAGTVGGSTFTPRRVGQPNPNSATAATGTAAPSGTGYGLGQVTPRQQALRDARAKAAAPPPAAAAAANKGTGKYAWSAEYGDEPENTFTEGQKAQLAAGNSPIQAWNSSKDVIQQAQDWQRWKLGEGRYNEINTYTPQQFYADQEAYKWGAPTSARFDPRYRNVGSLAQDTGGPGYAEGGTVQPSPDQPRPQPVLTPRYAAGGSVRPYNDDPEEARKRLVARAKAQGLTEGDLNRAQSDPSRYGEIHLDDDEAPAVKPRAKSTKVPKKSEPKKGTPEPKYTKEEPRPPDPHEEPRDEPGPRTYPAPPKVEPVQPGVTAPAKTHDELGNVIQTEGTPPLQVARPETVKTDPLGNVIEAGEEPVPSDTYAPGGDAMAGTDAGSAAGPNPKAVGIIAGARRGLRDETDPNLRPPAIPPQSRQAPQELRPYPDAPEPPGPARVPPTAPPRDPNLPPPAIPDQAVRPPLVPTREGVPSDRPDAMRRRLPPPDTTDADTTTGAPVISVDPPMNRPGAGDRYQQGPRGAPTPDAAIPSRNAVPPDNPNAQPELGGTASDRELQGSAGGDQLTGGGAEGEGTLAGGAGKDTLAGGSGDEDLSGKKRKEGQQIVNPDKKPQPAGTAITRALDHLEQQIRGDDQREAPAIGTDARRQGRLNNYLNGNNQQGTQAMSSAEYKEVAKTVDPQNKLDVYEKNIKMYQDLEDYWLAKGYPQKAAEATLGLMLYNKKVAQNAGGMALAALDAGDTITAAQWMSKAYAHVPNNQSLRVEPTEDGKGIVYSIIDRATGDVIVKPTHATGEQMKQMAAGMLSGKMFDEEMMKIAEETKGGKGRQGAAKKGPSESEVNRDEREAMGGIADATVELGKKGDEKGFNQGIEEARQKARRLGLNTDETNKFLLDIYKRSGVEVPEYLQSEPTDKAGKDAARQEKEDAAVKQEVADAEKSNDQARYSKAKNKQANIAFQRQKEDESITFNTENNDAFNALEPEQQEFLTSYGHQIVRKNRLEGGHAMRIAKNLTDPTKKITIRDDGRVELAGEPLRLYLSDEMLEWIGRKRADILKASKKAA